MKAATKFLQAGCVPLKKLALMWMQFDTSYYSEMSLLQIQYVTEIASVSMYIRYAILMAVLCFSKFIITDS